MKSINVWWSKNPLPGNFGDILTPILLKQLFDCGSNYSSPPFEEETLFGIGSTIRLANENCVVWGSGIMSSDEDIDENIRVLSVRGPRTYERLKELNIPVEPIFGDPALLLPEIYPSPATKRKAFKYGFFSHYVDVQLVREWYGKDSNIRLINPLNSNPLVLAAHVQKCEHIISSSLHGIIVAHAYGVPAVWVKHSDNLSGDDVKFHDYYESVGLKAEYVDFQEKIDKNDFSKFNYTSEIEIDTSKISKALQEYLNER